MPRGAGAVLFAALLNTPSLYAKFEQTTGTKVDQNVFGGMSDEEFEQLKAQVTNEYITSIETNLKKFNEGDKSSGVGGTGRYSGYGEAHVDKVDGMVGHEGGANAAESAIEKGALGSTGLSGLARLKAEQDIMDKNTVPVEVEENGVKVTKYRNTLTNQLQDKPFEISAAIYDAGQAHGNDPNASHRSYGLKVEVRQESEKNAGQYANKTIQDATLAPGKQPNLDLLHKAFSKMEQDKYIMMASDAMALRAARFDGTDTTDSTKRAGLAEYKQIVVDAYAANGGDIKAAEAKAREQLSERVALKKVVNSKNLCYNGSTLSVQGDPACKQGSSSQPQKTEELDLNQYAEKVVRALDPNADAAKIALYANSIKDQFKPGQDGKPVTKTFDQSSISSLELKDLSGIVSKNVLNDLYAKAQGNLEDTDQQKIAEYKRRLSDSGNKCFDFQTWCYSPGVGDSSNGVAKGAAAGGVTDEFAFQPVSGGTGDALGDKFTDTREMIFNKFAYAYNRPLAEWGQIIDSMSADFSEATDKNLKTGQFEKGQDGKKRDGKLFKEFKDMYGYAMQQADYIQKNADKTVVDRLRSAGASDAQLAQMQKNYSKNFDSKKLTFMQLFGQNKNRDAVMMDWRKPGMNRLNPYAQQRPSGRPAQKSPLSNVKTNSAPGLAGPN